MISKLKLIYDNLLSEINTDFYRTNMNIQDLINKSVIAIIGERGVGKTYFTLQTLKLIEEKSFYFSADNPLVIDIFDLVQTLYFDYKIKLIAIDEIHKGSDWKKHLKAIIDSFPDLKLIILGSSSLDVYKGTSDLQRRLYHVYMNGFNFSEFCKYKYQLDIPVYTFEEVITKYQEISYDISSKIDLKIFKEYLKIGYYPYSLQKKELYFSLLLQNLMKVLLEDIPSFLNMKTSTIQKAEKLFYYIAHNTPSNLNIDNLAKKIKLSNDTLELILFYLDKIGVVNLAIRSNKLNEIIRKEFKIFFGNPNIYYAYWGENDMGNVIGTIRESLILNILKHISKKEILNDNIILPNFGDFIFKYKGVQYLFEIGGQNKTNKQILGLDHAFVLSDDILISTDNKIPLWLFSLIVA